eukprot:m.28299 g.28299  ORF g.28299 m.28299 type:complete len:403 (+) comp30672_c0_seq2:89-1297(+)
MDQNVTWKKASNGEVPANAVIAGMSSAGKPVYVARVTDEFGDIIPGFLDPEEKAASIPLRSLGGEHRMSSYEVLTSPAPADAFYWKEWSQGDEITYAAIRGGFIEGEDVAIGRTLDPPAGTDSRNAVPGGIVGTISALNECFFVSYESKDHEFTSCSILCMHSLPELSFTDLPSHEWVHSSNGEIPAGSLVGGLSCGNQPTYVIRAQHKTDQLVPGQLISGESSARICWGVGEHLYDEYDILTVDEPDAFQWVWSSHDRVPRNAVRAGDQGGEIGYVGRTVPGFDLSSSRTWTGVPIGLPYSRPPETQLVGKIFPSHPCLYVPHNGLEFIFKEYEVLVGKLRPLSLQNLCGNVILRNVWGIPSRLDGLPLPSPLKNALLLRLDFCQPRQCPNSVRHTVYSMH